MIIAVSVMKNIYPKLLMAVALVLGFIGMPVRMDAQYATERIDYKRGSFYDAEGFKLGDEQIREVFGNDIYNDTYLSARKQFKAGKIMTDIGLGILGTEALFLTLVATNAFSYNFDDFGQFLGAFLVGLYGGIIVTGVGFVSLSTGMILRNIGNSRMKWMSTAPHGVGIAINF